MNHPFFWKCIFLCFDICILKKRSSNCWYLLLDGMLYWQLFSILQDHLKIIRPYDPYTATVCALYFIFGVVCAFFGYRCFKAIMFLYGFIFGSIVVYLICAEEEVLPGWDINQLNQTLSKKFNRVEQRPDSNVGGPSLWLDHYARPVRWPLHAWLPYRSSSSWQRQWVYAMVLLQWFSFFMCP